MTTEATQLPKPVLDPKALDAAIATTPFGDAARTAMGNAIRAYLAALGTQPVPVAAANEPLQARVQPWLMACFGPEISADKVERGDRLLEEVFELLQSGGYDPARVLALRDYVWNREAGEPSQEAGGVMITMAAYCLTHDLDMHEAGETELARIWTKVDKIRAKQAAKPVGSALPVALVPAAQAVPGDMVLVPREPTEAMAVLKAVNDDILTFHDATGRGEDVLSEETHDRLIAILAGQVSLPASREGQASVDEIESRTIARGWPGDSNETPPV
ncbi:hypothetical protein [Mesorhizobium sp.]|uniref:hypothetical protein n=1 Tax=Mesorhizobium sp. TaxID=1871066 RepID=UPI00257B2603|nr:hypothetical protein [Mesorhizobium sp.]